MPEDQEIGYALEVFDQAVRDFKGDCSLSEDLLGEFVIALLGDKTNLKGATKHGHNQQ
jgi:hypothetical protein